MSICLDRMAAECSRRLVAHDMMLRHLGLDPGPAQAPGFSAELRRTLRACTICPTPGRCAEWCRDGLAGTPQFCAGAAAFDALSQALAAQRRARVA